jgi:hypothetical protein
MYICLYIYIYVYIYMCVCVCVCVCVLDLRLLVSNLHISQFLEAAWKTGISHLNLHSERRDNLCDEINTARRLSRGLKGRQGQVVLIKVGTVTKWFKSRNQETLGGQESRAGTRAHAAVTDVCPLDEVSDSSLALC